MVLFAQPVTNDCVAMHYIFSKETLVENNVLYISYRHLSKNIVSGQPHSNLQQKQIQLILSPEYSACSLVWPLLWFLLLLNVFLCITVIMKVFILKLGENVGKPFIFSLANFGGSSLNGYVVITTK